MRLYAISTVDEYAGLQRFATSIFGTGKGHEFWVGGELIGGKWITSNGQALHSSAYPIRDIGRGNCLKDINGYGPFYIATRACSLASSSFCDYFDPTRTTTTTS